MSIIKTIAVRRNARIGIIVGIGIVIVVLVLAFCLPGTSGSVKTEGGTYADKDAAASAGVTTAPTGTAVPTRSAAKKPAATATGKAKAINGLVIDKSKITTKASFIPYEAGGVKMEVIAVKDSKGNVRTVLNTCQICFKSGKGYFVQEGSDLVCQNCKNKFPIDKLGEAKNGCNPVPIPAEYIKDDGKTITISADFLAQSADLFKNWKK
jgi:hypothetical protein